MSESKQLNRALTLRYGAALGLIAVLSILAFLLMEIQLRAKESHASLITMSGRQVVLSQMITLDAGEFFFARTPEERQSGATRMERHMAEMAATHGRLTKGSGPWPHPNDLNAPLAAAYFDGPQSVDRQVKDFLALGQGILHRTIPEPDLREAVSQLSDRSSGPLLTALHDVLLRYKDVSNASLQGLADLHRLVFVAMALLLLFEVLFIFRPLTRRLSTQAAELGRMARELTRTAHDLAATKDEMEGMVTAIAQDLRVPSNAIRGLADWLAEDLEGQIDDVRHGLLVRLQERSHRFERLLSDLTMLCHDADADDANGPLEVDEIGEQVLADIYVPSDFKIAFDGRLPGTPADIGPLIVVLRQLVGGMLREDRREEGEIDVIMGWRREDDHGGMSVIAQIVSDDTSAPREPAPLDSAEQTGGDAPQASDSGQLGFALVGKIVSARGGELDVVEVGESGAAQVRLVWPMQAQHSPDPRVQMLAALERMDEVMSRAARELGYRGGLLTPRTTDTGERSGKRSDSFMTSLQLAS